MRPKAKTSDTERIEIPIRLTSGALAYAMGLLNPNAFAAPARPQALIASQRLAIVIHNVSSLSRRLHADAEAFVGQLREAWPQFQKLEQSRQKGFFVVADGIGYLSSLHGVLYEWKAFLDIYAGLLCAAISPAEPRPGFNKGTVNGRKIAGGRLVNWVRQQPVDAIPRRLEVAECIERASVTWISQAVNLRDGVVHRRAIEGLRDMHLPSVHVGPDVRLAYVEPPRMPTGELLAAFAWSLVERTTQMVVETLRMIPGVNLELLDLSSPLESEHMVRPPERAGDKPASPPNRRTRRQHSARYRKGRRPR